MACRSVCCSAASCQSLIIHRRSGIWPPVLSAAILAVTVCSVKFAVTRERIIHRQHDPFPLRPTTTMQTSMDRLMRRDATRRCVSSSCAAVGMKSVLDFVRRACQHFGRCTSGGSCSKGAAAESQTERLVSLGLSPPTTTVDGVCGHFSQVV